MARPNICGSLSAGERAVTQSHSLEDNLFFISAAARCTKARRLPGDGGVGQDVLMLSMVTFSAALKMRVLDRWRNGGRPRALVRESARVTNPPSQSSRAQARWFIFFSTALCGFLPSSPSIWGPGRDPSGHLLQTGGWTWNKLTGGSGGIPGGGMRCVIAGRLWGVRGGQLTRP